MEFLFSHTRAPPAHLATITPAHSPRSAFTNSSEEIATKALTSPTAPNTLPRMTSLKPPTGVVLTVPLLHSVQTIAPAPIRRLTMPSTLHPQPPPMFWLLPPSPQPPLAHKSQNSSPTVRRFSCERRIDSQPDELHPF